MAAFGMESDAYWVLDSDYSQSLEAVVKRDIKRLCPLGFCIKKWCLPDGRNTLPNDWMIQSTKPSQVSVTMDISGSCRIWI